MLQKRIEREIGDILLDSHLITKEDLGEAVERQKGNGQSLTRNIVDLGLVDERKIAQCVAEKYRIPFISLDRFALNANLLHIVPEHISDSYGIVPLDIIGDLLTVGIVDMPDDRVIDWLQQLTGCKIQMMLITASDFSRHMHRIYNLSIIDNERQHESRLGRYMKIPGHGGKERRRFRRYRRRLKIKYEFHNEYNINATVNVSRGGVLLRSASPVPVNTSLAVRVELPASSEDIVIVARVVRVDRAEDGHSFLLALNFSSMEARDNKRLGDFVENLKR